jgi:hypothetical protein
MQDATQRTQNLADRSFMLALYEYTLVHLHSMLSLKDINHLQMIQF